VASVTDLDDVDPARGARVERAVEAALRGDVAKVLGALAEMSSAEREAFGPDIRRVVEESADASRARAPRTTRTTGTTGAPGSAAAPGSAGTAGTTGPRLSDTPIPPETAARPPASGTSATSAGLPRSRDRRAQRVVVPGAGRHVRVSRAAVEHGHRERGDRVPAVRPPADLRDAADLPDALAARGVGGVGGVGEAADAVAAVAWSALFSGPARLGWVFQDRTVHRRDFDEPRPAWDTSPPVVRRQPLAVERWSAPYPAVRWCGVLVGRVADRAWPLVVRRVCHGPVPEVLDAERGITAQRVRVTERYGRRLAFSLVVSVAVAALDLLARLIAGFAGTPVGSWTAALAGTPSLAVPCGVAWLAGVAWRRRTVLRYWDRSFQAHIRDVDAWRLRHLLHGEAEQRRLARLSDWASIPIEPWARRLDIVGGQPDGWTALLTVAGSSLLAAGENVTVLDLSGLLVGAELVRGARRAGHRARFVLLPHEQADIDLLAGLSTRQIVSLFAEARHGGSGRPDRGRRAVDEMILRRVCGVLGPRVGMARVAAGLRILAGRDDEHGVLTAAERAAFDGDLFSATERQQLATGLVQLAAMAEPLAAMGTGDAGRFTGALRVVAMSSEWSSASDDFLGDLLVGWLAQQAARAATYRSTFIVVGADRLAHRHVRKLIERCRRVRLLLHFQELSEGVAALLGSGPVGFMRLGNQRQADRAADLIGRADRFVLSQLSRAEGGTMTIAGPMPGPGRRHASGRVAWSARTAGWNQADTEAWSRSRVWGRTVAASSSTHWSDIRTVSRVRAHQVEPATLQALPELALLLLSKGEDGRRHDLIPIELDPEIAALGVGLIEPARPDPYQRTEEPASSPIEPDAEPPAEASAESPAEAPEDAPEPAAEAFEQHAVAVSRLPYAGDQANAPTLTPRMVPETLTPPSTRRHETSASESAAVPPTSSDDPGGADALPDVEEPDIEEPDVEESDTVEPDSEETDAPSDLDDLNEIPSDVLAPLWRYDPRNPPPR
jgi:hypothetical protein